MLELSLREGLALGHKYIGTEHILLGLVRENEGVAVLILLDLGADAETIRAEMIGMLSGPQVGMPRRGLSRRERDAVEAKPELGAEFERISSEKEAAIEAGDFERAAKLRERERLLRRQLVPSLPEPGEARLRLASTRLEHADLPAARRGLLDAASLAVGGALFAGGAGLGILVGWLVWA